MEVVVFIGKTNTHFAKFMDLLRRNPEIHIKDVKRVVQHSSYYGVIIKKLHMLNKLLREINPYLYLAEPSFDVTATKDIYTSIKRCPFLQIEQKEEFFIVRWNNDKTHTTTSNNRTVRTDQKQSTSQRLQNNDLLYPEPNIGEGPFI